MRPALLLAAALASGGALAQALPRSGVPGMPGLTVLPGAGVAAAPLPSGQWTVAQLGQAFLLADIDRDGQLTRAEAQQLAILPASFETLDADKDGLLERAEYERGAR